MHLYLLATMRGGPTFALVARRVRVCVCVKHVNNTCACVQRPPQRMWHLYAVRGAQVLTSTLYLLARCFAQQLVIIRVVYPSEAHPLGPRFTQNLRTDRREVLTKYGLWGSYRHQLNVVIMRPSRGGPFV